MTVYDVYAAVRASTCPRRRSRPSYALSNRAGTETGSTRPGGFSGVAVEGASRGPAVALEEPGVADGAALLARRSGSLVQR